MKEFIIESKGVKHKVLVDDEDYDFVCNTGWWFIQKGSNTFYARGEIDGKKYQMHRVIYARHNMLPSDRNIDHIDRNGLNNQKSNLRLATDAQNGQNRGKQSKKASSKYKGVNSGYKGQWIVQIKLPDGRFSTKSNFDSERDAAIAYDVLAQQHYGDFACLNISNASGADRERVKSLLSTWKFRGKTSKYRGVCLAKDSGRWQVQFWMNGKCHYFGQYNSELEAAKVYNREARLVFGEKAKLNPVPLDT